MRLDAGAATEYEQRHNPIWPELEAAFVQHGVHSYSIFLDPLTNDLFAYAEIESEECWNAIRSTEVCRRWWRHMCDLMPTKPDHSPLSRDLREVFHLRGRARTSLPRRSANATHARRRAFRTAK